MSDFEMLALLLNTAVSVAFVVEWCRMKPLATCWSEHDAIKQDHSRWSQLIFNGYMETEDDEGNPALLEIRTCQGCKSTLAVLVLMRDGQEVAA